jgi:hypothetical protein
MKKRLSSVIVVVLGLCFCLSSLDVQAQTCGTSPTPGTDLMSKCLPPNPNIGNTRPDIEGHEQINSSLFSNCSYLSNYRPRIALHEAENVCAAIVSCNQGAKRDVPVESLCPLVDGNCPTDPSICANDEKVFQQPGEVQKIFCLDEHDLQKADCVLSGSLAPGITATNPEQF